MGNISSTDLQRLYDSEDYISRYHKTAGERITRLLNFIQFSNKDKVLDVGCGNGLLLPEIISKIGHYDGVDFSPTFIKEAKARAMAKRITTDRCQFHVGDIIEFCKSNDNYDKVFALDFTEHINDHELKTIFTAIKKAMKKNSQLIIHTPNKNYILEKLKSDEVKINKQGHIGLRDAHNYMKIFEEIGFDKVTVIPLNHYLTVLKPLHILSYIPVKKAASLFQARLLIICEV